MLDKSVPHFDVMMARKQGTPIPEVKLPNGYKFTFFKLGDEKDWAIIETSVLEFPSEIDSLLYFQKQYLPYIGELEKRCIFIENAQGEKVATCTGWWDYNGVKRHPTVHWCAVKPEYQGLGLGKAIVTKITQLMVDIEGDIDMYLHTQTWSHKAIKLYEMAGYEITDEKNLFRWTNENYDKAMKVLKQVYN